MSKAHSKQKTPAIPPYQVVFTYSFEWEPASESLQNSHFKFAFPNCFTSKQQITKLPLSTPKCTKTHTITATVDSGFIDNVIKNGFLHLVYFPAEVQANTTSQHRSARKTRANDSFLTEYLQVDCTPVFVDKYRQIKISVSPPGFKFFTFSLFLDKPFFSETMLRKYQPAFIHLKHIVQMPQTPLTQAELAEIYAPVFGILKSDSFELCFIPKAHESKYIMDSVIMISPETQMKVVFELHDRDTHIPETKFTGSGMITPIEQKSAATFAVDSETIISSSKPNAYGYCELSLLPQRKDRESIRQVKHYNTRVPPANFFECQTELVYEIFTPFDELPVTNSPAAPSPPTMVKGKTRIPKMIVEETGTRFYRWVYSRNLKDGDSQWSDRLVNLINEHNSLLLDAKNSTILQTYNFELAQKKALDLITGVHITTPVEELIIFETRAHDVSSDKVKQVVQDFPADQHMLGSLKQTFTLPRLYTSFDTLFATIQLPYSALQLTKLDGLYLQKSLNSVLYKVVSQVNDLLESPSLSDAIQSDLFPEPNELIRLLSRAPTLQISQGISTTHVMPGFSVDGIEVTTKLSTNEAPSLLPPKLAYTRLHETAQFVVENIDLPSDVDEEEEVKERSPPRKQRVKSRLADRPAFSQNTRTLIRQESPKKAEEKPKLRPQSRSSLLRKKAEDSLSDVMRHVDEIDHTTAYKIREAALKSSMKADPPPAVDDSFPSETSQIMEAKKKRKDKQRHKAQMSSRPMFEASGRNKRVSSMKPRELIGSDGDTEVWITTDPESLKMPGYEVQVIKTCRRESTPSQLALSKKPDQLHWMPIKTKR